MIQNKTRKAIGFALFLSFIPFTADASLVRLNMRCSEDSLSTEQSVERVEWATKCNHITADDRSDALFTGSGSKKRERPMYPLFATADLGGMWKAPVDRNAPCTLPPGYQVMAFCTSSCYTPDQVLLFPEGFVPVKKARDLFLPQVVTLDEKSTLNNIRLTTADVASYTEEVRDTWHDILVFKTKGGGELKVTKNHPVIDSEGRVRTADSFAVGESLVHFEQGQDPIVAIEPLRFFGKVYNITPASEKPTSHIVIAEGYLNGSAHYQNDGANFLNRTILRKTIPAGLVQ
jgi:hypothetical protein